jgi:peptide/nickel transport system permease protein
MSAVDLALPAPRRRARAGLVRWLPATTLVAAIVLALVVAAALGADLIRPLDDTAVDLDAVLQPPSWAHPFGTDEVGRDVLARVLHGLRISLLIACLAATAAVVVGGTVGVLAGSLGGRVDAVVMRCTDAVASQNHLLSGILLVVLFRPVLGGAGAVMLSIGLTHWPSLARIVRGELLALRERPFVAAAIGGGAGRRRLVRRHYLPHLLPALGLAFVLTLPHAVFHESALSFLGLGLPPHQASLGNILADSQRSLLAGGWWVGAFAGAAILLVALAVAAIGEHGREKLHPRWRSELEL